MNSVDKITVGYLAASGRRAGAATLKSEGGHPGCKEGIRPLVSSEKWRGEVPFIYCYIYYPII